MFEWRCCHLQATWRKCHHHSEVSGLIMVMWPWRNLMLRFARQTKPQSWWVRSHGSEFFTSVCFGLSLLSRDVFNLCKLFRLRKQTWSFETCRKWLLKLREKMCRHRNGDGVKLPHLQRIFSSVDSNWWSASKHWFLSVIDVIDPVQLPVDRHLHLDSESEPVTASSAGFWGTTLTVFLAAMTACTKKT